MLVWIASQWVMVVVELVAAVAWSLRRLCHSEDLVGWVRVGGDVVTFLRELSHVFPMLI